MKMVFFKSSSDLRKWFERHHASATELWVGFYKKNSGKPSITWPESVAEALCFGWIDGIRKSVDDLSYTIRFSPRKPRSVWSAINIKLAKNLVEQGRMHPAGLKAFDARIENKSRIYSYEQSGNILTKPYERKFKANKEGWAFFQSQPPWYRRTASWYVLSAKKKETQLKRLEKLIEDSASGRTISPLTRKKLGR